MRFTMITAHAGAENTPDNTMESVRAQLACGAEAIEIDVWAQGERLVMAHDRPGEGDVCEGLEACFAAVAHYADVMVNVDVKAPDLLARVAALSDAYDLRERILFTGDVLSAADFAAAKAQKLTIWYNHTQIRDGDWLGGVTAAGFEVLNAHYRLATREMLESAPERLSLWTVNDEAALRMLLEAGVRNITTRIPVRALALRREIQGK